MTITGGRPVVGRHVGIATGRRGAYGSPVSERAIAFAFEQAAPRAEPLVTGIACDDFASDGS
ncbi:hypothetical protein AB0425_15300 [Actinosynnema sp. NPDC051121]